MKTKKVISLCLTISIILALPFNVFAINQSKTIEAREFTMLVKDTETGVVSSVNCDTSLTTRALNAGAKKLSTPAFDGILSKNTFQFEESVSPKSVIGDDTRYQITTTDRPTYRSIGELNAYWDTDGDGFCETYTRATGVLVGPNEVLTAGHAVYNSDWGGWCSYAEISFAQNGNQMPYGTIVSTRIHIPDNYVTNQNANYDCAIIEIEENIGNTLGWFGKLWTSESLIGTDVSVTGYPSDKEYGTMWRGNGHITSQTDMRLFHDCDTFNGNSGGVIINHGKQILGIHTKGAINSGGTNSGTRMIEEIYNYIEALI